MINQRSKKTLTKKISLESLSPEPSVSSYYPLSPQLLGEFKQWLRLGHEVELLPEESKRTEQRYLRGQLPSKEITPHLSQIVERFTQSLLPASLLAPESLQQARDAFQAALRWWDHLASTLNSLPILSEYTLSHDALFVSFGRLWVLEFALRWGAYQRLRTTQEVPPVFLPLYLTQNPFREQMLCLEQESFLRTGKKLSLKKLTDTLGKELDKDPVSQDELSARTVQMWRSGKSLPVPKYLDALAVVYAALTSKDVEVIRFQLRLASFFTELKRKASSELGETIEDWAVVFEKVSRSVYQLLAEASSQTTKTLLLQGTGSPADRQLCEELASQSLHPAVKADFLALAYEGAELWWPRVEYWLRHQLTLFLMRKVPQFQTQLIQLMSPLGMPPEAFEAEKQGWALLYPKAWREMRDFDVYVSPRHSSENPFWRRELLETACSLRDWPSVGHHFRWLFERERFLLVDDFFYNFFYRLLSDAPAGVAPEGDDFDFKAAWLTLCQLKRDLSSHFGEPTANEVFEREQEVVLLAAGLLKDPSAPDAIVLQALRQGRILDEEETLWKVCEPLHVAQKITIHAKMMLLFYENVGRRHLERGKGARRLQQRLKKVIGRLRQLGVRPEDSMAELVRQLFDSFSFSTDPRKKPKKS